MNTVTKHDRMYAGANVIEKLIAFLLSTILLVSLSPAIEASPLSASSPSTAFAAEPQQATLTERLLAIEGITNVETINQQLPPGGTTPFKEKLMVTVEQPLDWNNPSLGTFQQRIELGYQGGTNVNVIGVNGYCLSDIDFGDTMLQIDDRSELCRKYNGNLINIEYRFFGKSTPAGLSNESTALWEYLTVENAAQDFHAIIEKISQVLSGKRIFTGKSKGGYTTNMQACLFPNDADSFVSFVSPLCNGPADDRMYTNVYKTIGDVGYPADQAKEYRDTITRFQVACIVNRSEIMKLEPYPSAPQNYTYYVGMDTIFEVQVLEYAGGIWMSEDISQTCDAINKALAMPEGEEKIKEITRLLQNSPLNAFSLTNTTYAYLVQAQMQMGNYAIDFSYLREALAAAYNEAKITDPTVDETKYQLTIADPNDPNRPADALTDETVMQEMVFTSEQ